MGRPRDVVAFAIYALETARKNDHTRISKEDIYQAEVRYSEHMMNELRDEISEHVDDTESVVNVLKALERRKLALELWDDVAQLNQMDKSRALKVRDLLFEASAVGVLRGDQGTSYRYSDRSLKVEETGNVSVHHALLKELSLIDG